MAKAVPMTCGSRSWSRKSSWRVRQGVTLELTHDEARTLGEILANVGGDPRYSARKHAQGVVAALYRIGYGFAPREEHPEFITGSIFFLGPLPEERA